MDCPPMRLFEGAQWGFDFSLEGALKTEIFLQSFSYTHFDYGLRMPSIEYVRPLPLFITAGVGSGYS